MCTVLLPPGGYQMCTVLLPPGVNPIAVKRYIVSYIAFDTSCLRTDKIVLRRLTECEGTCQVPTAADTYPGVAVTFLEKLTANPKSMSSMSMLCEPENSPRCIALCGCDKWCP